MVNLWSYVPSVPRGSGPTLRDTAWSVSLEVIVEAEKVEVVGETFVDCTYWKKDSSSPYEERE